MKHIVEVFGALVLMIMATYVCIALITVDSQIVAAKSFNANCVAEIENSNFNTSVINSCISQASSEGYTLQVTNYTFDVYNDINTAEVILSYEYKIPLFGISRTTETRGIAR